MLREELGWNQQKSDELLLPVIQRVNKRGATAVANKQSNLDAYFGDSIGGVGVSAIPRKRQAYTSKRLQKVVTGFREEQRMRSRAAGKQGSSILSDSDRSEDQYAEGLDTDKDLPVDLGEDLEVDGSDDNGEHDPRSGSVTRTGKKSNLTTIPTKRRAAGEKRKTRKTSKTASRSTKRKKRACDSDDCDDGDEYAGAVEAVPAPVPAGPRPKPVRKKANTNSGAGFKTAD